MRWYFLSLLALALVVVLSCQPGEEQQFIVRTLNEATDNDNPSVHKTLLVISSGDCGKCFSTQLRGLLETERLDGAMIVSFEGSSGFNLDEEVAELLSAHSIPLYQKESSKLLVEIGKYSGNPRSPYLVRYARKELEIDALVKF
jgi:hypothetical protein